jgi:hypothetical protein
VSVSFLRLLKLLVEIMVFCYMAALEQFMFSIDKDAYPRIFGLSTTR